VSCGAAGIASTESGVIKTCLGFLRENEIRTITARVKRDEFVV
jgi:hypothetical protein